MPTYPTSSLAASLRIQTRVIWALVLREIITRYGRHNIGFLWLFVEPMLFTTGIAALWTALHATHGSSLPIIPFAITGYSGVLLWRNGVSRCANAVEPNKVLLFHRNVRVLDFFLARVLLEIAGATASFMLIATSAVFLGLMKPPADIGQMVVGWLLLAWYALGLGLVVGALSERSEMLDRVWHTITYLYFPFSGAAFMVSWLPRKMQQYAQYVPTVNLNEMIRGGYFGSAVDVHFDVIYMIKANLILTVLGLAMVRDVGRRVEGE
ncbi:capsular polysaccharide transport system permease protein [Cupriavidus metallidurans]|jgi:capsular polysaccharide transport system permease protein|uniref:ABC transporter permease n=1 Tax=Cupriavidus metallidurans TaxID=119219 RepID=UPI0004937D45|nr:ABC transporter permease [Cupriavidus metallidurans]KWW39403.1 Polysialic acid transport protein KpsM [Cupriavidus metallidurans]MDE4920620.1 ABC transporter permease [Cupriavidus metallidurans]